MKYKANYYLGLEITIFAEDTNDDFQVWGVDSSYFSGYIEAVEKARQTGQNVTVV